MKQGDKDLLLKDLCIRLPYRVKVDINFWDNTKELNCSLLQDCIVSEKVLRPYLRPMSSMTEKEREEYNNMQCVCGVTSISRHGEMSDWLNAHHFDYRGLIEKGLALEAPEGMYKTE